MREQSKDKFMKILSQDGKCGIKVLQEVTWEELGKESMGYTSSVLVRAESSRVHHNFMVTLNYTDAQISPRKWGDKNTWRQHW